MSTAPFQTDNPPDHFFPRQTKQAVQSEPKPAHLSERYALMEAQDYPQILVTLVHDLKHFGGLMQSHESPPQYSRAGREIMFARQISPEFGDPENSLI